MFDVCRFPMINPTSLIITSKIKMLSLAWESWFLTTIDAKPNLLIKTIQEIDEPCE